MKKASLSNTKYLCRYALFDEMNMGQLSGSKNLRILIDKI